MTYADVDTIRPPTPRLTLAAVLCIALGAAGAFTWGVARQVIGPLGPPPAEVAAPGVAAVQPLAPEPITPAMQAAATVEPAPRSSPKLDVPRPAPVAAAVSAPVAAPPAAPIAAPVAQVEPAPAPAQPEEPPTE